MRLRVTVNQSFAGNGFRDLLLVQRGLRELPYLSEVREHLAKRIALISWKAEVPKGLTRLRDFANQSVEKQ